MFWVDDGDAKTEAGELQPLSKFGIYKIMVPTNKDTLQGDYTKKDKETLTLSGGQYQEPLPEVQEYPTDEILPPVLENTAGREFVLGGTIKLESHTEYDIWHPGDKKQVDTNVNKVHQHINDGKARKIAEDIFNKIIPIQNNTADVDKAILEREMLQELNTHREQLEISPFKMDVTLLQIDVSEQLRRTTRAKGHISDSLTLATAHPDLRDLEASIEMDTEIKHSILDTTKEYDLFPQLLQFHQFFAQKQVKSIKERMESGDIKLQATGAQVDEKSELMTILDGIYSQFSKKDVAFANIDLKKLDIDIKGDRRELSNVQALDAWFATEDAQDAQREENKPPQVDTVSFSENNPSPGDSISSTVTGSDPENFDLAWEWTWKGSGVEQKGTATGKTLKLDQLTTSPQAKAGDKYGIDLKLTDALGAYVTHKQEIDGIQPKPPSITSLSVPNRVELGRGFRVSAAGTDPDGNDSNLKWAFSSDGNAQKSNDRSMSGANASADYVNRANAGTPSVRVTVTDEQGLSASTTKSYLAWRQRRRRGDPLIFDLNQDGKVNLTGGTVARNATSIPVGLWDITVDSMPKDHRYVVSDANSSNGTHESAVSVNSSGRWKVGMESMDKNGQWNPLDISANFKGDEGSLTAGALKLSLTRTSDGGYQDDGMGFTSVGGDMVEFDMHPDRSSWSKRSYTYRPGLGAPSADGGQAKYDTGNSESIGATWQETVSKGNKAKIHTAAGEWIGEWIGGDKSEYFYGTRKDVERTQWISGDGDGLLVWDHNGNGTIDDSSELMSEFDISGNHAFANGLEKLAHYFDKDGNGVIEAHEMQGLMFWIDDGDAKTEEGELIPPWKLGITEIIVPVLNEKFAKENAEKLSTTSTKEEWKAFESEQSSSGISLNASEYTPDRTAGLVQDDSVPVESDILVDSTAHGTQTAPINTNHPTDWEDVKATVKIETEAMMGLKGQDAPKMEEELPSAHQNAVTFYIDKLLHRIETAQIEVTEKGAQVDPKDELRRILDISNWGMDKTQIVVRNGTFKQFDIHFDYKTVEETTMKIWEVFFDHEDKESGKGKRIDPLILDLNRDGKFDITGANQEGNGKIDGDTVSFDIDPSKQSWKQNSPGHRPGYYEGRMSAHVDPVPNGKAVYNTGKSESTNKHGEGRWTEDTSKGVSAKIFDADGKWVGEWVARDWGNSHGGRLGRYYFSPHEQKENTEWMKGTGDGFLVWDKNGKTHRRQHRDDVRV